MDTPKRSENPYSSPRALPPNSNPSGSPLEVVSEGVAEERDVVGASMLMQKRRLRRVYTLFAILGSLVAVLALLSWRDQRGGSVMGIVLVAIALATPWWFRRLIASATARYYRQSPLAKELMRRRITTEHVESTTATVHSVMRWEAFNGFVEADDMMLIRSAHFGGLYYPFYRSHFAPPDWEQFRNLVRSKLNSI